MEEVLQIPLEDYIVDGRFEATNYFRDLHKKILESMDVEEIRKTADMKDTVTLFHGTTTAYLNSILKNGVQPRKLTGNDNWRDMHSSAENVVYLTNKWHYFYAYQVTTNYTMEQAKEKGVDFKPWWETGDTYPCYIECEVPKALLVADEDFYHSQYVSQKIKSALKRRSTEIKIDWKESLAHYGTAGVLGGVPPEYIKSFSILAEPKLYYELMHEKTPYQKDLMKWGAGKGKGEVKLIDLQKREDSSLLNGCWFSHQFAGGVEITQIGVNPKTNTIACVFRKP